MSLHIWNRKEIENYLLVPSAIARYIAKRIRGVQEAPDEDLVSEKLAQLVDEKKTDIFNAMADEVSAKNRGWLTGRVNEETDKLFSDRTARSGNLALVPGKTILSQLSRWSMDTYGVGLSHPGIAAEITTDELDSEVKLVLRAIETGIAFVDSSN